MGVCRGWTYEVRHLLVAVRVEVLLWLSFSLAVHLPETRLTA